MPSDTPNIAGYKLVEAGTLMAFEVVKTDIKPTSDEEDKIVEMELQLDEELVESCSLGFMFVMCLQSFHHGRPRGYSGNWFEDDDQFTVEDFLDNLRYWNGRLHIFLDYMRGRCLKTTITIDKDGKCRLQTYNRGEALTRWVDLLRGKKFLAAVPPTDQHRTNRISAEFTANRAKFEHSFQPAYEFLNRLEAEGPAHGLWLSTATNAHLYKNDGFLAYLRLKNPELQPPVLVLSPSYNQRIVEHTKDRSGALFPDLVNQLVKAEEGEEHGWATRGTNGAVELTANTPASFFDRLFGALLALDVGTGE